MKTLRIPPVQRMEGTVRVPGSKSLSNRYLLMAALASGRTRVENLLKARDIELMRAALTKLGVDLTVSADGMSAEVTGNGGRWAVLEASLHLGNAGTAMRPLCAALATAQGGTYILDGDKRMTERPIAALTEALRHLGAEIEYLGNAGYPPLRIKGHGLKGGSVSVAADVSSQFLSALLMAAPLAREPVEIVVDGVLVSKPYVDLTIASMAVFGVEVARDGYRRFLVPRQGYRAPTEPVVVEGDASSASYFLAAGAIRGGTVRVEAASAGPGVQGDARFAEVLEKMGAQVRRGDGWIEVKGGLPLTAVDLDLNDMPDAAMTLAVSALFAKGRTTIRNIATWRVKETDRLAAMATELRKLGATVVEGPDFIEVDGLETIQPAALDTYDDHRMAMSLSLAALGNAEIIINDPDCTSKTFPDYFERFEALRRA